MRRKEDEGEEEEEESLFRRSAVVAAPNLVNLVRVSNPLCQSGTIAFCPTNSHYILRHELKLHNAKILNISELQIFEMNLAPNVVRVLIRCVKLALLHSDPRTHTT